MFVYKAYQIYGIYVWHALGCIAAARAGAGTVGVCCCVIATQEVVVSSRCDALACGHHALCCSLS